MQEQEIYQSLEKSTSGPTNENPMFRTMEHKMMKTGTTIVGLKYATGVVLCADTRSTSGNVVANKNCEKIHRISDKIFCCGAGVSADTARVSGMAHKELQLFSYRFHREPFASHAERLIADFLFSKNGFIQAHLILGGVDNVNGIYLSSITGNGYVKKMDYLSMGSGSFAATGVLEEKFKKNLSRDDAVSVGCEAIRAGIMNDLFSGSNIDVVVIDKEWQSAEVYRNYEVVESKKNNDEIKYPHDSVISK